ncbi:MAG: hypothetical protein PQJ58_15070 [Spirochaetales bacterium]|nr:hypothetical protein [Spirochaetales bacterium]
MSAEKRTYKNIPIPTELHRKLKALSVFQERKLQDITEEALSGYLDQRAGDSGEVIVIRK